MRNINLILLLLLSIGCSDSPNKAKMGFTAKEAEQLASSRALEIMNSPFLVSIQTPEEGGGINTNGRLAKGEDGRWLFGYYTPGVNSGLLIEVTGTRAFDYPVPLSSLRSLQEISPNYIDSSDAVATAEKNGGSDLENVQIILCELLGEPTWPAGNPDHVAWKISYHLKDKSITNLFIDAYSGNFLGRG